MALRTRSDSRNNAMNPFVLRYADRIVGVLSGFDRLVFRGSLRALAYTAGMLGYLCAAMLILWFSLGTKFDTIY